jgi:hypothetical protein
MSGASLSRRHFLSPAKIYFIKIIVQSFSSGDNRFTKFVVRLQLNLLLGLTLLGDVLVQVIYF